MVFFKKKDKKGQAGINEENLDELEKGLGDFESQEEKMNLARSIAGGLSMDTTIVDMIVDGVEGDMEDADLMRMVVQKIGDYCVDYRLSLNTFVDIISSTEFGERFSSLTKQSVEEMTAAALLEYVGGEPFSASASSKNAVDE